MIARTAPGGPPVGITGVGAYVPSRVVRNTEVACWLDVSEEWILQRSGIRERRVAAPEEAASDLAVPAARAALAQAGSRPRRSGS